MTVKSLSCFFGKNTFFGSCRRTYANITFAFKTYVHEHSWWPRYVTRFTFDNFVVIKMSLRLTLIHFMLKPLVWHQFPNKQTTNKYRQSCWRNLKMFDFLFIIILTRKRCIIFVR